MTEPVKRHCTATYNVNKNGSQMQKCSRRKGMMDWDKVQRDLERTQRRIDDPRTRGYETLNLIAFRGMLKRLIEKRCATPPE